MEIMQWAAWLAGAVAVVGLVQWAKNFAPGAPTWVWRIAMPAVAIGVAFASKSSAPWFDAMGVAAISQLGYELIVQQVKKRLGGGDAPDPSVKGFQP